MSSSRKHQQTVSVDQETYQKLTTYAAEHGLSESALIARMWLLWERVADMQKTIIPIFPPLQESLEAFLEDIAKQSVELDEEYLEDDQ